MKEFDGNFDTSNIHSVELNLLDGQVELILRDLDLPFYDPFMIIEKTEGQMAEKGQKVMFFMLA